MSIKRNEPSEQERPPKQHVGWLWSINSAHSARGRDITRDSFRRENQSTRGFEWNGTDSPWNAPNAFCSELHIFLRCLWLHRLSRNDNMQPLRNVRERARDRRDMIIRQAEAMRGSRVTSLGFWVLDGGWMLSHQRQWLTTSQHE